MDTAHLIAEMNANARAIAALTQLVSDDAARWRPEPDAWSVLDVINHLAYEERHDFWDRLDMALHRPQEDWPSGDPARGVTESSRKRALEEALDAFLASREESLAWLRALERPDWDASCKAPFGNITAGDILAAWAAHDLLHMRQLVELRYQILSRDVTPYGVRYAGEW